jgi:hypothetical protein
MCVATEINLAFKSFQQAELQKGAPSIDLKPSSLMIENMYN